MYFQQQIDITIGYRGEQYRLELHREHMIVPRRGQTWLVHCDKYGRTGTSQCFDALRFRISGHRRHRMLTTDGMTVEACRPGKDYEPADTFAVTDADRLSHKEQQAIQLLQSVARGYRGEIEVGYSGGKDSDIILDLTRRSGIRYRAIYHSTTIDPPGTAGHIRQVGGVETVRPEKSFFQLIAEMGMPNRFYRHCCENLKEHKTLDKAVMGIRKAESTKRDKRYDEPTECRYYGAKTEENHVEAIYPILTWTDEDVLNYIDRHSLRVHPLYYRRDGSVDVKRRLGCMCCPLAYYKKRIRQFEQYPKMVRAYCRAAQTFRETHPDVETVGKYRDVYQWFFREVFFERQKKWERWLASNDADLFGIRDYREWLQQRFKVSLPDFSENEE